MTTTNEDDKDDDEDEDDDNDDDVAAATKTKTKTTTTKTTMTTPYLCRPNAVHTAAEGRVQVGTRGVKVEVLYEQRARVVVRSRGVVPMKSNSC